MTHIPPDKLLPQDMVDVLDTTTGVVRRVHATLFREAAERDDRFVLWAGKVVKAAIEPDEPKDFAVVEDTKLKDAKPKPAKSKDDK